jgi:predicted Zn-dependent protease
MRMSVPLEQALRKLSHSADWVGVRHYRESTSFRMARNGKVGRNSTQTQDGCMVEVLKDGQFAYAGSSDLSQAGLQHACDRAMALCLAARRLTLFAFDKSVRPDERGRYASPAERPLDQLSAQEIQARLIELTRVLGADARIIEASAWAMLTRTRIAFASSSGANWVQDFDIVTRDMTATARQGGEIQRRSLGMQGRQWGAEALELDPLKREALRIREQALELLAAPECPTEVMDLILMPDQLYLQVHESIGHPLELDRILGDERNYAGWSFVRPEDFGQLRWGPEILNVSFDPALDGEMASYAFDDNGVRASKQLLIENGMLQRAIGGIESQARSAIPGVSCARSASWNRPPLDRMANINIEPGESSLQQMIAATARGILMQTNRSWSIDDYRNKFQFGCEYAQLIEDGRITRTLKNPNYRGATLEFWNKLSHVGDRDTFEQWGSPYCGKAEPNQVIRVGHAIPACRFRDIDVFGGAQ